MYTRSNICGHTWQSNILTPQADTLAHELLFCHIILFRKQHQALFVNLRCLQHQRFIKLVLQVFLVPLAITNGSTRVRETRKYLIPRSLRQAPNPHLLRLSDERLTKYRTR